MTNGPSNINIVYNSTEFNEFPFFQQIHLYKDNMFVIRKDNITSWDITDPTSPVLLDTVDVSNGLFEEAESSVLVGDYLITAPTGTFEPPHSLQVWDVSTPSSISLIGNITIRDEYFGPGINGYIYLNFAKGFLVAGKGSTDVTIGSFNMTFMPSGSIDIGNDGSTEWTGNPLGVQELDFTTELNSFLPACSCTGCTLNGDWCTVDIEFNSGGAGKIYFDNLQLQHE
jgi:hypothetical protein